jgi:uncharacterized repeat protein (TIGR01451 family)
MKTTLFTITLLLISLESSAQCYPVFKKMDKQPQFYYNEPMDRNFPYYYQYTDLADKSSGSSTLLYGYWDGNNWIKLGPNKFKGYSLRLLKWGKRIIGYGTVTEMEGMKAPAHKYFGVMEYKGGKWDSIPGCSFDSGVYIQACSNDYGLYVKIQDKNDLTMGSVYKYDTSGLGLVKIMDYKGNSYNISLMTGKKRILLSNVNKINGFNTRGFAYIENGSIKLSNAPGFTDGMEYAIDKATDHIFAFYLGSDPEVFEYGDTILPSRKTRLKMLSPYSPLQVYNGQLIWQSYDPTYSKFFHILCPGDSTWKNIYCLTSTGINMTNPYGSVNGIYLELNASGHSSAMVLDNGAVLNGIAFIDKDSNCLPDSGEHRLKNYNVYGKSSKFYASSATDDSGRYQLFVIEDTILVNGSGKLANCAGANAIITQTGNAYQKHVPIKDPSGFDIKLKLISQNSVRWNSMGLYGAEIENNGYPVDSAYFEIILDPKLKVKNVDANFYKINGNAAAGHLYGLDYYEKRWVYLSAWIDTLRTKPDTMLCNQAFVGMDSLEFDQKNNRDGSCQKVVYSFDPNHKQCSEKIVKPGVSSTLEYYIEFQNEGNDDAYDVVVIDALSTKLDWKTLKVNSASHPYTVTFNEGQLKFTFKDIHLKPKNLDEAMSKGYIGFSINTAKGLVRGDSIQNNAFIYFDLNAPVVTNMSVVKIDYNSSVNALVLKSNSSLLIYPNPAQDILSIRTSSHDPIIIYNMMGEQVYDAEIVEGAATCNISALPAGIYVVRCGQLSGKFIKNE